MILHPDTIRDLQIVYPCESRTVMHGLSYGLSHAGYDIRIKQPVILPPGGFTLASSVEQFRMPLSVTGIVHDKSTWARRGLSVFNTVIEPGWMGFLTLELVNHSAEPLMIDEGSPIAQVIFHRLERSTHGYSGKYHNQDDEPVPARSE